MTQYHRAARSADRLTPIAPGDLDDATLWAGLATGEEAHFAELFHRHNKVVYNFAFRSTASWSSAEDITQTVFMKLWTRARKQQVDQLTLPSAVPLLLSMTRNECLNQFRQRQRHVRLVGRATQNTRSTNNNVSEWMERESTMSQIRDALEILSPEQLAVVELVAWAGLGMFECGEVLGIPEGTVKSRLNRARQQLRATSLAHLAEGGPQ